MNDENLEQLEDLLRELPLRRPSPELDRRVEAVWQARSARWTRWTVAATVATVAAAAAGLLWMVTWNSAENGAPTVAEVEKPPLQQAAPAPPEQSPAQPIVIEKVWATQSTTGIVVHDGNAPMQQVHQQIVRHVRWIDEQNHVSIEWTIPSDQTVLVPLEYN